MKQAIKKILENTLSSLKSDGIVPNDAEIAILVEETKDKQHGDFSTNLAMILAKPCKQNPRALAETLISNMPTHAAINKVEIAGPGFINFFLAPTAFQSTILDVLSEADAYGRSDAGNGKKVLIEFLSCNPTGPLHVGHGRGGAIGASMANVLDAVGYQVDREYYVNDAGRQMHILATSLYLRCLQERGLNLTFPSNGYQGDYLIDIAKTYLNTHADLPLTEVATLFDNVPADAVLSEQGDVISGDKEAHIDGLIHNVQQALGNERYQQVLQYTLDAILDDIRQDLEEFGVVYQNWFSEKALLDRGAIEHSLDTLDKLGYLYEQDGAIWFKSTQFGDDKDRVLKRANGQTTYFASDVAYHLDKLERGYDILIDVLGADHHGYTTRLKAALKALSDQDHEFHIPLVQFAILYRGKERVQMSTRSGSFVTFRALRNEVGNDAARFFYVMRKCDQHLDFDLELAKSRTNENPVYYIQYAHARICSVLAQADDHTTPPLEALTCLTEDVELKLMQLMARYPELLQQAARDFAPHLVTHYLRELATALHSYYNATQFLVSDDAVRQARLALISAVKQVLANGLSLVGVSAPESM